MVPRRNVFVEGVLLRDVPVLLRREEYVSNMAQSKRSTLVVMKDEQTKFRKEECANDMVQRLRLVVMMDVRTKLSKEGYASSTVQRLRLAVMKDVPTKLSKEEFVKDMVQRCSAKLSRSRVNVVDVRKCCVRVVVAESEIVRYLLFDKFCNCSCSHSRDVRSSYGGGVCMRHGSQMQLV